MSTICEVYENGKIRAFSAVNTELVQTYWEIGKYIVEFEQNGAKKAEYGKGLLEQLSRDLSIKFISNSFILCHISKNPDSVWKIKLVAYRRAS